MAVRQIIRRSRKNVQFSIFILDILDDGFFEVALVKYPATLADLNALVSQAVSRNYNGEMLTIQKAKRVRFTFAEPVPFTRDGEPGGVCTDVRIENLHAAVRLIV